MFKNDRNKSKRSLWILDENFWEMVGWAIGDGSYCDKTNRFRLYGSVNEYSILERFRLYLLSYIDVPEIKKQGKNVFALEVCSKSLNYVIEKVVGRLDRSCKVIPDMVWSESYRNRVAFLRGLFSSDGSCKVKRDTGTSRIRYVSTSKLLVQELQVLLNSFGYDCSYGVNGTGNRKDGYTWNQAYQLSIRGTYNNRFYDEVGFLDNKSNDFCYVSENTDRTSVYETITDIEILGEKVCCGALS